MSARVEHTDVGAYALGLLEDGDRRAFEAHLHGCGACRAELNEIAGTAGLLSALGETEEEPSPVMDPPLIDMVRRKRRADRRSRRVAYTVGAAAAAVALAAGIGVGTLLDDDGTTDRTPAPPAQAITGERFRAADAGTGASGTVGLVDKGWGTQVALELRGIRGPLRCHLEAVSRDGERSVVAGWRVPAQGYGVPGQPKPLVMQGGTGLTRAEISRFEVRLDDGRTLLRIPL